LGGGKYRREGKISKVNRITKPLQIMKGKCPAIKNPELRWAKCHFNIRKQRSHSNRERGKKKTEKKPREGLVSDGRSTTFPVEKKRRRKTDLLSVLWGRERKTRGGGGPWALHGTRIIAFLGTGGGLRKRLRDGIHQSRNLYLDRTEKGRWGKGKQLPSGS